MFEKTASIRPSWRAVAFLASTLVFTFGSSAHAQVSTDRGEKLDQDELTSFYGRANVVLGSGARALGMGGAFLARADDATAASWNPAGLSYLRRTEASFVGVANRFEQDVTRLAKRRGIDDVEREGYRQTGLDTLRSTIGDFASFAYPFRLKGRLGALQASYQRVFSFSGNRNFRGFSYDRQQDLSLLPPQALVVPENPFTTAAAGGFDTLTFATGVQVHRTLRVGMSLNLWTGGFDQTVDRFPNEPIVEGERRVIRTISSEWGLEGRNANFGMIFTPVQKINIGAVYKTAMRGQLGLHKIRVDKDPPVLKDGVLTTFPAELNEYRLPSPSGDGALELRLPRVFGFGVSVGATNTLTFSADITDTQWSKATIRNFFTLTGGTDEPPTLFDEVPFPGTKALQADARQFRAGVEWILVPQTKTKRILIPFRAGWFRDGQPELAAGPNGTRSKVAFNGVTLGAGIDIDGKLIDIAYVRESGRVSKDSGLYDRVRYQRFLISFISRFGERR